MPHLSDDSDGDQDHDASNSDHRDQSDVESVQPVDSAPQPALSDDGSPSDSQSESDDDGSEAPPLSDDGADGFEAPPLSDDGPDRPEVVTALSDDSSDSDSESDSDDSDSSDLSSDSDDSDSTGSSSDSDDEGRYGLHRFLDIEATETEEEESEDDDDERPFLDSFPQFSRLPPELRRMIWEAFCPDLTDTKGRVYDISGPTMWETGSEALTFNVCLPERTLAARTVLAVNQESRGWAEKAFPDMLPLPYRRGDIHADILRFDKQKDIIVLPHLRLFEDWQRPFLRPIHNLAIDLAFFDELLEVPHQGWSTLPNLKNVFFVIRDFAFPPQKCLSWCATKDVIISSKHTFTEQLGHRKHVRHYQFCWPDLAKWPDFSGHELEMNELWKRPFPTVLYNPASDEGDSDDDVESDDGSDDGSNSNRNDDESKKEKRERIRQRVRHTLSTTPIWPLVEFDDDDRLLDKILAWNGKPEDWVDDTDGGYRDSHYPDYRYPDYDYEDYYGFPDYGYPMFGDEYDSSGLDDSEWEDFIDDDDLIVDDASDSTGSSGGEVVPGPQSPQPVLFPNFSSPDIDSSSSEDSDSSATVRGDSPNDEEEEAPRPRARSIRRKANMVADSSDEDDGQDDHVDEPLKHGKRKRHVPDDSSSSEDESLKKRSRRRKIAADSDSGSEEEAPAQRQGKRKAPLDDSDPDDDEVPRKRARRIKTLADSSESEEEEENDAGPSKRSTRAAHHHDDSSSENDEPPKRTRKRRRVPDSDSESEGSGSSDSENESGGSSSSESDSEDGDERPAKPMTLFEKLAMGRRQIQVPSEDEDESEGGSEDDSEEEDEPPAPRSAEPRTLLRVIQDMSSARPRLFQGLPAHPEGHSRRGYREDGYDEDDDGAEGSGAAGEYGYCSDAQDDDDGSDAQDDDDGSDADVAPAEEAEFMDEDQEDW